LSQKIKEREQRVPLSFSEFMELSGREPSLIIRNIFQIFYDMIYNYIGDGADEYPEDPESISFVYYDCSRLFVEGTDHPFFADRLFANRLLSHISSFRQGIRQNRIYIFEGPHGCGKSTFLNNLLLKFEQYTKTDGGVSYETLWRLNKKELGAATDHEAQHLLTQLRSLVENSAMTQQGDQRERLVFSANQEYLEVPCPSHDNPLLLIPKAYRREYLDELIKDEEFKERLFSEKQYEWVFKDNPCTICMSLYQTLLDLFDSPLKAFEMVCARRYIFNRRLGQGISVFNPGDRVTRTSLLTNQLLQNQLNGLLRDSNRVRYVYSRYANTNNGIYALMDIKAHNKERFANLHGIISEGVHKVEDIEENVNSLFLALMNPEDQENVVETQSFSDRITYIKIPYILDYNTEVKIYKNVFGDQIESYFLPRVLENFAKVIISTRLNPRSDGLQEWILDSGRYRLYCDRNLMLLKMDIYTGRIPPWLSEEDRKNFTARRRRRIIAESETEGNKGFTGRDSIKIFSEFFSTYAKKDKLVTMAMVVNFFRKYRGGVGGPIPDGFLDSLIGLYNYTVLQEVKESLYYYNEERISREIQNYLFAINFEPGRTEKCIFTGEELEITEDFFEAIERRILGSGSTHIQRRSFRADVQNQYASKTLTQEILLDEKPIYETQLYLSLYQRYIHNLKENVLDPFLKNDNFRSAIKDYATETFKSYDKRIREDVALLIQNLNAKYGYTELGAKEVCIYVIDNNLAKTFSAK
jgi:predicted Ser/Thr protein kinase